MKKKSNWPYIITFLFLLTVLIANGQKKISNVKQPNTPSLKNTIPLDTPRYYFRVLIDAKQLKPTLDTIDAVIGRLGETMTVSEAKGFKEIAVRNIQRLIYQPTLDSIKVTKK